MHRSIALAAALLLAACARPPLGPAAAQAVGSGGVQVAGLWGPQQVLRAGLMGGPVRVGVDTAFLKDPSFVADGRPLGGGRWIAFGDLRGFWLKAFDVDGVGGPLVFRAGEQKLLIDGLAPAIDSSWAPQITVQGDRVKLIYSAGEMPAPEGPRWPTFQLRIAETSLAAFEAALAAGQPVQLTDRGPILTDLTPFGPGVRDFGVIDPHFYETGHGRAYMTYTVVRPGKAGERFHEEFVRYREVDPRDPTRALGPDRQLVDGRAGSDADGVAEAQEIVRIGKRTYAFVSIRAGDQDQRIVAAEVPRDLGAMKLDAFQPFRYPGAEPWMAKAVGSCGVATIGRSTYIIHQGLSAQGRFGLGWTTVVAP